MAEYVFKYVTETKLNPDPRIPDSEHITGKVLNPRCCDSRNNGIDHEYAVDIELHSGILNVDMGLGVAAIRISADSNNYQFSFKNFNSFERFCYIYTMKSIKKVYDGIYAWSV